LLDLSYGFNCSWEGGTSLPSEKEVSLTLSASWVFLVLLKVRLAARLGPRLDVWRVSMLGLMRTAWGGIITVLKSTLRVKIGV
jgi:hypothetical protein